MWVHSSILVKIIAFPHKSQGGDSSQVKSYKNVHNYCRKHRKFTKIVILHNRIQNSEKFSPNYLKNWHFLKCHSNCSTNKCKLLTYKVIKAAIDRSYVYCRGNTAKCYKHALFSLNALLFSQVLESQLTFPH